MINARTPRTHRWIFLQRVVPQIRLVLSCCFVEYDDVVSFFVVSTRSPHCRQQQTSAQTSYLRCTFFWVSCWDVSFFSIHLVVPVFERWCSSAFSLRYQWGMRVILFWRNWNMLVRNDWNSPASRSNTTYCKDVFLHFDFLKIRAYSVNTRSVTTNAVSTFTALWTQASGTFVTSSTSCSFLAKQRSTRRGCCVVQRTYVRALVFEFTSRWFSSDFLAVWVSDLRVTW